MKSTPVAETRSPAGASGGSGAGGGVGGGVGVGVGVEGGAAVGTPSPPQPARPQRQINTTAIRLIVKALPPESGPFREEAPVAKTLFLRCQLHEITPRKGEFGASRRDPGRCGNRDRRGARGRERADLSGALWNRDALVGPCSGAHEGGPGPLPTRLGLSLTGLADTVPRISLLSARRGAALPAEGAG